MKMDSELMLLQRTGAKVTMLDSGCCGMAGPFGFEKEKFGVSQALAERVLLPAIRNAAPGTLVVTDGFSCREQVTQNLTGQALHFAEAMSGDLRANLW
jgi:Fe-S oxidoreductase